MKLNKYVAGFLELLILLSLDQISKYWAIIYLKGTAGIVLIQDIFELQYLENHGAAFGILQNQRVFLLCITVAILAALGILFWRIPHQKHFWPLQFTLVLLVSGAVGNMIDRFWRGYVVDFFYFKLIDFPIFNIADCYVVVAAFLGIFFVCFYYQDEDLQLLKGKNSKDFQKKDE
ncbi:MAG: signal peptidase II [Clostridiaceae bacterium]|nr:signal peptidase II [Clostridiaceae bacterium]